jgi:Kef-type K+ transport system membrane component KefB
VPADLLGGAAEEPAPHPGVAAAADHDAGRAVVGGGADDLLRRMAGPDLAARVHAVRLERGGGLLQPPVGVFLLDLAFLVDLADRCAVVRQVRLHRDHHHLGIGRPAAGDADDSVQRLIGWFSFATPFGGCLLLARYGLGWDWRPAEIAGVALSTTSVAVVYAVLVETGLNATFVGTLLMSSTFVTDFGTVLALSVVFIHPSLWLLPFVGVSAALIVVMPRLEGWFFARYGKRVIEPEIKGAFAALLLLMFLADKAQSHAVLPAFLLGLAVARTFERRRTTQQRFRVVAFALLTPAFFVNSGLKVSLALVWANLGLLGLLLAAKLAAKSVTVYPFARRYVREHATFTTLLMSTGLTFGTISATYGYNAGIIDRVRFSVLVTVVVLTAVLPTAIAQRFFAPATTPHQPPPDTAPAGHADRAALLVCGYSDRPGPDAGAHRPPVDAGRGPGLAGQRVRRRPQRRHGAAADRAGLPAGERRQVLR